MPIRRLLQALTLTLSVSACVTSPTGRTQFMMFPEDVMSRLGTSAFNDIRKSTREVSDGFTSAYVACVADGMLRNLPPSAQNQAWETVVFESDSSNAFALPGGKIGVNTGMLEVAKNQDQLATVIGHEIAHVLARHANERISSTYAADVSLRIVSGAMGASSDKSRIMGLLGLGTKYGMLLPYNRDREAEADILGLELMAKAGYDPRASVQLWRNMAAANPGSPPEFLSTHPSHQTRIAGLQHRVGQVMPTYQSARAAGYVPDCDRLRRR